MILIFFGMNGEFWNPSLSLWAGKKESPILCEREGKGKPSAIDGGNFFIEKFSSVKIPPGGCLWNISFFSMNPSFLKGGRLPKAYVLENIRIEKSQKKMKWGLLLHLLSFSRSVSVLILRLDLTSGEEIKEGKIDLSLPRRSFSFTSVYRKKAFSFFISETLSARYSLSFVINWAKACTQGL